MDADDGMDVAFGWLMAFGARPTRARIVLTGLSPAARLMRGLVALLVFWGGGVLALFVPVAHVVLVPSLLVIGVVAALRRARQTRKVVAVYGVCPRCLAEQQFAVSGPLEARAARRLSRPVTPTSP